MKQAMDVPQFIKIYHVILILLCVYFDTNNVNEY